MVNVKTKLVKHILKKVSFQLCKILSNGNVKLKDVKGPFKKYVLK